MTNVQNSEFQSLTGAIRRRLPVGYLVGILGSYAINALLIVFFLSPTLAKVTEYALYLAVPGAIIVQYFRFLIVFTDQLFPSGRSSSWIVQGVALAMTVWGMAEVWHLVSAMNLESSEFWGIYGFAASIVVAGYILEINYVSKTNQLTIQEMEAGNTAGHRLGKPKRSAPTELLDLTATNGNGHH